MRYLLQRVLTGEWLTRDFELADGQRTRALSGPGGITGTVSPHLRDLNAADGDPLLWEWGTQLYAEIDGRIRNAGIITKIDKDGELLTLEAPGFTTYPHGIPYADARNYLRADPLQVTKDLWFHVQNMPNSHLGVTVDDLHSPESTWIGNNENPYTLLWWENRDCGSEIDSLAKQTPFDYIERHAYSDDSRTTVLHHVQLGYPRLGRKRTDLRFAEGENITDKVVVTVEGDDFANEVIGIGRGEGAAMIHNTFALVDGRLRRPKIVTDKTADQPRLDAISLAELNKRLNVTDVTQVTIQDHANARLTAIDPGDDIYIQAHLPWVGEFRLWLRVLSITESDADPTTAVLATRRSDSFIYSATTEIA